MFTPPLVFADCNPSFTKASLNGFGKPANIYMHSMDTFAGYLYVGTLNRETGAEIWRYNGTQWEQVVSGGLGNINAESVRTLDMHKGKLYIGTAQCWHSSCEANNDGAEVWPWSGEICTQ